MNYIVRKENDSPTGEKRTFRPAYRWLDMDEINRAVEQLSEHLNSLDWGQNEISEHANFVREKVNCEQYYHQYITIVLDSDGYSLRFRCARNTIDTGLGRLIEDSHANLYDTSFRILKAIAEHEHKGFVAASERYGQK